MQLLMHVRKSNINIIFNCFSLLHYHICTIPGKYTNRIFQAHPAWFHSVDFTNKISKSFSTYKSGRSCVFPPAMSAFLL